MSISCAMSAIIVTVEGDMIENTKLSLKILRHFAKPEFRFQRI